MRHYLLFTLALCLLSCQDADPIKVEVAVVDDKEYELTEIPGSVTSRAERKDPLGNITEAGYVLNGLKQGTWTTYNMDATGPEKIISYVDGALNGPYIEMDKQGRYALLANYQANALHGPWVKYRIGRPEQTANYVNGQLHGIMATFDYRNNKIKEEVTYKNGLLDGPLRHFNDAGEVILEYLYKDGEKVSGGIVE